MVSNTTETVQDQEIVPLALYCAFAVVKLRQGSGKDRQGMAVKAKGLKA